MYLLPVFFLVYYSIPDKFKNSWIVLASLLFYGWGAPVFIFTAILSCLIDYYSALQTGKKNGRIYFYIAIALNILMLGYFKYADFFIENFNFIAYNLTGREIPLANIVLPIGISFLTFQKMSYLVDVHRKDCEPQHSFLNYVLFVLLFPQLIAGPIVRYKEISNQISNRFKEKTKENTFSGIVQFIIGLSKKVLLANVLGAHADSVFNGAMFSELDFTVAWTGILAYTFQIYFDFSGYSDMAIGLGRMMGFRFPQNFNFPYSSQSITEFWRRWHMTLGNWMKDYLYVPLGGNRYDQTYRNLMIVFLVSGLWHGASWNFVLWGAFHGTFLVLERLGLRNVLQKSGRILSTSYAFLVVMIAWVLFRSESIHEASQFYSRMFSFETVNIEYLNSINPRIYFVFFITCIFSFIPDKLQNRVLTFYNPLSKGNSFGIFTGIAVVVLYILNLGELMATGFNPFIYFRF